MAVIERARITRMLQLSLERGIAMVIAPAGFGKSEAVAAAFGFAKTLVLPDGDVTIDGLARALLELTNARNFTTLGQVLRDAGEDDADGVAGAWLAKKLRVLTVPVLVEDFQRINADRACSKMFARVVEATAPKIRWIITARETPNVPLGTWMARDLMQMPLTVQDLCFSVDDARELAKADGVALGDADLEEIVESSQGWPMAVALSIAAWSRTMALAPLRSRTNAIIFDYIEEQIWSGVSDADRDLLTAAALLHSADPRVLEEAGCADARARLHALSRRVPLLAEGAGGSYRLQSLFAEFLVARHGGATGDPPLAERLLRELERSGETLRALQLAARSGLWGVAARLLDEHGYELVDGGSSAAVLDVLRGAPRELRDAPIVAAVRGIIRFNEGSLGPTEADLRTALTGEIGAALRRQVRLRLAQLSINRGDPAGGLGEIAEDFGDVDAGVDRLDALALTAAAKSMLGDVDATRAAIAQTTRGIAGVPSEVRARLQMRIAFALYGISDYAGAETRALEAAELADACGMPSFAARSYSVLQAVAHRTHSDTGAAVHYARLWLAAAREAAEKFGQAYALMALVYLAALSGDDDLYRESTDDLRDIRLPIAPRQNVLLRWARVIHDVGHGRLRDALLSTRSLDLADADEPTKALWSAISGVLYAAAEQPDLARSALHRPIITQASNDLQSRQYLAYAHSYRALGLWLIGQGKLSQRTPWHTATDLPEHDVAQLSVLRSICSSPHRTMTSQKMELLTAPLHAFDLGGQARFLRALFKPAQTDGILSGLELEVLREFHRGGTYVEVADRMQIAPRTVEKRLQTACRKLACSGRNEAVAYALSHGWLE